MHCDFFTELPNGQEPQFSLILSICFCVCVFLEGTLLTLLFVFCGGYHPFVCLRELRDWFEPSSQVSEAALSDLSQSPDSRSQGAPEGTSQPVTCGFPRGDPWNFHFGRISLWDRKDVARSRKTTSSVPHGSRLPVALGP